MTLSDSDSEIAVNFEGDRIGLLRENDPSIQDIQIGEQRKIQEICAAVQDNSSVDYFELRDSAIDPPAVAAISNAIAKMPHLGWFVLMDCSCGEIEVFRALASALANKDSLEMLELSCCYNFGDRGAQVIAAFFRRKVNLRSLVLVDCDISNEGAIAIASLISSNNRLKEINLGINDNCKEGAMALAQSISQNQTLEKLYFDNNFSEEDYFDIRQALKKSLYNDETIESVLCSNHTLIFLFQGDEDLDFLLRLNRAGPEQSRRSKIIKFLNDKPRSLLSMNFELTQMPTVLDKIGRVCQINTMFELVRNMPDLFNSPRSRPYRQCWKRSRLSYR